MKSIADKIVDLLEQDPGVIGLHGANRGVTIPEGPEKVHCRGCGAVFQPKGVGRQYCSRSCYEEELRKRRKGKKKRKPMELPEGSLGPGRRFVGAPAEYAQSRLGLATVHEVREEIFERFGLRVGITTIYRVWRSGEKRRR